MQAFTLIGRVTGTEPYQHDMPGHCMWRRDVLWQDSQIALIRPLLQELEVTRGLNAWGMAFRYGLTKITKQDFERIAQAMVG